MVPAGPVVVRYHGDNHRVATWEQDAEAAARRYGVDPEVFKRQMGQEAHGEDLTSPAGAQGPAQFMPDTARSVGLTSKTVHQRVPAYNAAAKLMAGYVKKYGSHEAALRAYNAGEGAIQASRGYAETNNYVKTILGGKDPGKLGSPSKPSGSTPVAAPGSSGSGQAAAPVLGDAGQAPDVTSLLASLLSRPAQAAPAVQVDRPQFAAAPALPGGVQLAAPQTRQGPQQAGGVDDALSLLGSLRGTDPAAADPVAGDAGSVGQEPVAASVARQRKQAKSIGLSGSKILELIYNNGGQGYGIKDGQDVNGRQVFNAVWAGHANHVHVAAGPKTTVALGKYAQKLGLHVGENPQFGGVDPGAHVQGSYHVKGEAIDVSGQAPQMEEFARAVDQYNRTRRLPIT